MLSPHLTTTNTCLTIDQAFAKALQHHQQHQLAEAENLYQAILAKQPDHADTLHLLGVIYHQRHQYEHALNAINQSLVIHPHNPAALSNKGLVLQKLKRLQEAIACYDQALTINADLVGALHNRANAFKNQLNFVQAIRDYQQVLHLAPHTHYCLGTLIHCQRNICDWRETDSVALLESQVLAGARVSVPFALLSLSDNLQAQLICAQRYVADKHPTQPVALWQGDIYSHQKIRLAYLSADFREHALSYLLTGVLEQHNRQQFEVIGISFREEDHSSTGQRIKQAFDQFIDVSRHSDDDVAQLLRRLEIDIAIDLMGFTQDSRPTIFAHRPAPIQINYLGYPSTMGADYMDYMIGDTFVSPKTSQAYYQEKIIYLPDSFQANDVRTHIASTIQSRRDLGLPPTAFVFCSFNNNYKLNPLFVDCWIRLLAQVPHSVLWLLASTPLVETHLRAYVSEKGIDANRLIFANRKSYPEHLERLQFADLFLDSLPFNAGTTASDALWAGLPVLTCAGQSFAGRMAGSLLTTLGLPELITYSLADYEQRAQQLATEGNTLSRLRAKLAHAKTHTPLFNSTRFCRQLESAYHQVYWRYQHGLAAESIDVARIDA